MRAEIDVASARVGTPWVAPPTRADRRTWLVGSPDWFELLVLAAFAAVSVWVLGLDLWQVAAHGRVWTGTDGFYLVDQMQYLAWIQSVAHHGLVANLFVLHPTAADYFQPAITISGGLSALGVPPWLSLLVWKPIAVVAIFYGVRAYAHRSLEGTWPRRVALLLGLFFGSVTISYGSVGVLGDLFPAFLSWGYTFGLLAIAVMLFALVAYGRARAEPAPASRLALWGPGLLGAFASLIHPWQGELLILIVVGAELALWRLDRQRPRRLALPLITVIMTGAPLLYYEVLGRADPSWKLAREASKHGFPLWAIVLGILPLLLPALLAYRDRPRTLMDVATRVWPAAALVIYALSASSVSATPLHAFGGITVPLSILAIQGIQRIGFTRLRGSHLLAAVAVGAATIPATVSILSEAKSTVAPQPGNANFITRSEQRALRYLAKDKQPGGVVTRYYLGAVIPAYTGRRTFLGDCLWSEPGCNARSEITQMVFDGTLPRDSARWFVQRIGARFLLSDCTTRPDMTAVLAPLTVSVHRFGCAAVYTLRTGGQPSSTA